MTKALPPAALFIVVAEAAAAGAGQEGPPRHAEAGVRLEGTVAAGVPRAHELAVRARRFVRLLLQRDRADVALSVRDPAGRTLVEADTLVFPPGPRPVAFVTTTEGVHGLEVRLLPAAESSAYSITVLEERAAAPGDDERAAAERAFLDGERLRITGTAEALAEARHRLEEALATARRLAAAELEADALTALGRVREALSERKGALEAFEAALVMHRRLGRRSAVANVLNYASQVDEQLGDRERTRARLEAALVEGRAAGDRRAVGITLGNMANLDWAKGEYRRAIEAWELAVAEHRAAGNPRGESVSLNGLGVAYDNTGDKPRALEYLHRALALSRAIGDPRDIAGRLNNIGTVHFALDEIAQALDSYQQAVESWRAAGDRSGEGATLHNIARVHEATGEYQQALERWRESLRLLRATSSTVRVANVLTRLGHLYATLGEQRQALAAYEEALGTHRATGNRPFEAATLSNLGTVQAALGDGAGALRFQEQALALFRKIEDPSGQATALAEIGRTQAALGNVAAARSALAQALELWRTLRNRRGEAAALVRLAELDGKGDLEAAVTAAGSALSLFREVGDRAGEASARYTLARLQRDRGDLAAARAHASAGLEVVEVLRAGIGSQELRAAFLATAQDHYELLIDLLARSHVADKAAGHDREAFHVSERARARSLLDLLGEARAGIREGVAPGLLGRERRLAATMSAKATRLQQSLLSKPPDETAAARLGREIDALSTEWQALQGEIRAESPRYAALAHPAPLGAQQLQKELLDAGSVLLEYALGRERSFVWAVTRETLTLHELPPRAIIEAAARAFIESARGAQAGGTSEARALSRMLLGPVAGALSKARRIAVVGDGALLSLPFAALPAPGGDRPLVLGRELVALPSASTLAALRRETERRAPAPRTLAILADPVFDADDPRVRALKKPAAAAPQTGAPGRLLGSRREARAILDLVPPSEARAAFDFEANRALATSAEFSRFRIVHLATHGVLDDERPALSGVVLSLVDAEGRPQDGFLRLQDVYNLRWPAELVVLSACESGLGKEVRGEGLLGLARGFMYAGAPRVLTTLWKVDDRATAFLMGRLYAEMLGPRRLAPAAALRVAQSAMREEPRWRAPYYWAGFVLQGDWR